MSLQHCFRQWLRTIRKFFLKKFKKGLYKLKNMVYTIKVLKRVRNLRKRDAGVLELADRHD